MSQQSCSAAPAECLAPNWKVVGLTAKTRNVRVIASAAKVVFEPVLLPNDPADVDNIPVRANCTLDLKLKRKVKQVHLGVNPWSGVLVKEPGNNLKQTSGEVAAI